MKENSLIYHRISQHLSNVLASYSRIEANENFVSHDITGILKDLNATFPDCNFTLLKNKKNPEDSFIIKCKIFDDKACCIKIYDECWPSAASFLDDPERRLMGALAKDKVFPPIHESITTAVTTQDGSSAGSRVVIYDYVDAVDIGTYIKEDVTRYDECKQLLVGLIVGLIKNHKVTIMLKDPSGIYVVQGDGGRKRLMMTDTNHIRSAPHAGEMAIDGRVRKADELAEKFLQKTLVGKKIYTKRHEERSSQPQPWQKI